MDISSLFGGLLGSGGAGGGAAAGGAKPEMYFGSAPVYGTTAVSSPANAALGVAGGTANANPGMPPGATVAAPPQKNSMSGGGSVGGALADSIKAIGDMIANYQTAGAMNEQTPAAAVPNMTIQPALATFAMPSAIGQRRAVTA